MTNEAVSFPADTGLADAFRRGPEHGLGTRSLLVSWRFLCRKPLAGFGAILLIVLVITALGANWISPYDPLAINPIHKLLAPTVAHPFGTDNLGRDLLSRVIYGARPSLYTGVLVVSISSFLGLLLGVSSGFLGGKFDLLVQRVVDGVIALPGLVFAMALLTVFSSGIHIWIVNLPLVWHSVPLAVVATLVFLSIPSTSRVMRSATLAIIHDQYVEAAQAMGASSWRIIWLHLTPNVLPPLIVIASAQLGSVILIEASLSFLGLGLPPPNPSWGSMLQGDGIRYMQTAPWLAIFPGVAISLAVLAFNLFGDGLRDVLDPRLRGRGGA